MSAGDNDPSTNSILGKLTRELGIDQISAPSDGINLDDVADVLQRQPSFEPVGSSIHILKTYERILCVNKSFAHVQGVSGGRVPRFG